MKRILSAGLLVPLLLAVAGVALIIASRLELDAPSAVGSLAPIPEPTHLTPGPAASRSTGSSASATASPTPQPTLHSNGVALQIQIDTFPQDINLPVKMSTSAQTDSDPPADAAYILSSSSQPGRGTNSYIFAHARNVPIRLFKNLWNIQLGARVLIRMSDNVTLEYRVTEVHPNVACPDPNAPSPPPADEPLALRIATDCSEGGFWINPHLDHERLTLQTSQGYNRNYGEFVVVAKPVE